MIFLISFEWILDHCNRHLNWQQFTNKLKGEKCFSMKGNMHVDEKFSKKIFKNWIVTKYEFKMYFEKFGFKRLCDYNISANFPKSNQFSAWTYLEFDSRRRLCWTTEVAGLILGVAQRDVLRSHWSSNLSSSSSVGPPTS